MGVLVLSNEKYDTVVKEGVVLVDFFATWCGPCKMLAPMLDMLAEKKSDIKIVKVDVDKYSEVAMAHGVMSVPTMLLYKDGKIVSTNQGFQTLDMLETWIDSNIKA